MIKTVLFILSISLVLVSCSTKTDSENNGVSENCMDGDWKIVKAEGTMAELNIGTHYIFEGMSLTLKGGGVSTPGKYSLNEDTIIFRMDNNMEMKYVHKIKNKQLIIQVVGSDQVFYLDRE